MSFNSFQKEYFKGTANSWYCGDGRIIPVKDLTNSHLKNIISLLHIRAADELRKDSPYPNKVDDFTSKQTNIWLLENCITWPALVRTAVDRGIWDYETRQVKAAPSEQVPNQAQQQPTEDGITRVTIKAQGIVLSEHRKEIDESKQRLDVHRKELAHLGNQNEVLKQDIIEIRAEVKDKSTIQYKHRKEINELRQQIEQLNNILVQEKQNLNYKIDMQGASFNSFTSDQDKRIATIANELRNVNRFLTEKFSSYSTEGKF